MKEKVMTVEYNIGNLIKEIWEREDTYYKKGILSAFKTACII